MSHHPRPDRRHCGRDRHQIRRLRRQLARATTPEDIAASFPTMVVQACDVCGAEQRWVPIGIATLPQWIAHFTDIMGAPYYCPDCTEHLI